MSFHDKCLPLVLSSSEQRETFSLRVLDDASFIFAVELPVDFLSGGSLVAGKIKVYFGVLTPELSNPRLSRGDCERNGLTSLC